MHAPSKAGKLRSLGKTDTITLRKDNALPASTD
jgi:hypothetical protein